MLWTALRWNWGNTLPIAAFCLLTIITLGEGWAMDPADMDRRPALQDSSIAALSAELRQPAAATALSVN